MSVAKMGGENVMGRILKPVMNAHIIFVEGQLKPEMSLIHGTHGEAHLLEPWWPSEKLQ